MSIAVLRQKVLEKKNPTVAGLDARLEYIPAHIVKKSFDTHGETLMGAADALLTFNKGLMDCFCDIVPAVKPQLAYYERLGWPGMKAFYETVAYAKEKGLYVIADGKRNDIGSTATAYAEGYLGTVKVGAETIAPFPCDGLTINAYLGEDGVKPFVQMLRENHKSAFVLVKTSNPSSGQFQNRSLEGAPLYERMAEQVAAWGKECMTESGFSELGAVVGATYPEEQKAIRSLLPHAWFLVPGYGAQGATAKDIKNAFLADGTGAIVNSSRGILCAWQKTGKDGADYQEASRAECLRMRDDIASAIGWR